MDRLARLARPHGLRAAPSPFLLSALAMGLATVAAPFADAGCDRNCPADLTGDGTVDGADLGALLARWGPAPGNCADFNGTGMVDGGDLGIMLASWGPCPVVAECPVADHGCCVPGGPGCTDDACCDAVCMLDPFCCVAAWDALCLQQAVDLCGLDCPVVCATSDHGCLTEGGPGCTDFGCCDFVCSIDPFCCEVAWDVTCVGEAKSFCGEAPPINNFCVAAIPISDGTTSFTTLGATTDGPELDPSCDRGFGLMLVDDIWFDYTATQSGLLTVSTCNQVDYDSRLAVYAGFGCVGELLACNDDFPGCTFSSLLRINVELGQEFKIRVGGFASGGSGTITLGYSVTTICPDSNHDCFTTGDPGCTDEACCEAVCAMDGFCCQFEWDANCVAQAEELCAPSTPPAS